MEGGHCVLQLFDLVGLVTRRGCHLFELLLHLLEFLLSLLELGIVLILQLLNFLLLLEGEAGGCSCSGCLGLFKPLLHLSDLLLELFLLFHGYLRHLRELIPDVLQLLGAVSLDHHLFLFQVGNCRILDSCICLVVGDPGTELVSSSSLHLLLGWHRLQASHALGRIRPDCTICLHRSR